MPRGALRPREGMLRAALVNNWEVDKGAQRSATTLRRRRGFSTSLAEGLIISLLLLLSVLGIRMSQVQREADDAQGALEALQASLPALKPLLANLPQEHQSQWRDVQEFARKVARVADLEKEKVDLARELSDLRSRLAAKFPSPEAQSVRETSSDRNELDATRHDEERTAKAALPESERPFLHDRVDKVSLIVESKVPPSPVQAAPEPGPSQVAAGPRRIEPRPACRKLHSMHHHAGRRSGEVSPWCP